MGRGLLWVVGAVGLGVACGGPEFSSNGGGATGGGAIAGASATGGASASGGSGARGGTGGTGGPGNGGTTGGGTSAGGTSHGGAGGSGASGGSGSSGATGGSGGTGGATGGGGTGGPSCDGSTSPAAGGWTAGPCNGAPGSNCTPITSVPPSVSQCGTGCADGTREGFYELPGIAACAGGWQFPGSSFVLGIMPSCNRQGGNTGPNPTGAGCSIADLCAEGWHVCNNVAEVMNRSPTGCSALGTTAPGFFLTRQSMHSGDGGIACDDQGTNNFAGCAGPNTVVQSGFQCGALPIWTYHQCACANLAGWCCGTGSNPEEGGAVVKSGPDYGGVLCCSDPAG